MATSGSFYTSSSAGRKLKFSWSKKSQSAANNTTTISWSLTGAGDSGYVNCGDFKVKINGDVVYSSSTRIKVYNTTTIASGTKTIKHNADGTKKFSAYVEASIFEYAVDNIGDDKWDLPTIARKSTISSITNSKTTLPCDCTVKWNRESTSFYHKIKLSHGNWSNTVKCGQTTSYKINVPLDALDDTYDGKINVYLYTYSDKDYENSIGSDSGAFNIKVPDNIKPKAGTITLTPKNISLSDGTTAKNILVKGKNKLTIKVTGSAAGDGSSIKSYKFSGSGLSPSITSVNDDNDISVGPFTSSGTKAYTATLTDNRSKTATSTKSIKCYDYSKPTLDSFDAYRVRKNDDGTYTKDTSGTYIEYRCKPKFSSVNKTNHYTITRTCTDIGTKTTSREKSTSTDEFIGRFSLDGDNSKKYKIYLEIKDNYDGAYKTKTITVFGDERIINIKSNGNGIAFGKMSEESNCIDSKYKIWTHEYFTIKTNNRGLYLTNASGNTQPAVFRNSNDNLWIGAKNGSEGHITGGGTYISAGDNEDIYVNKKNGNGRTSYKIIDSNNRYDVLYSTSDTYNAGTITLSSSAANYNYLEIFYCDNTTHNDKYLRNSMRVYAPDGKAISTTIIDPVDEETRLKIKSSYYIISGKTITKKNSTYVSIKNDKTDVYINGTSSTVTPSNHIRITRVLGYK